jgi:hypothetical protein
MTVSARARRNAVRRRTVAIESSEFRQSHLWRGDRHQASIIELEYVTSTSARTRFSFSPLKNLQRRPKTDPPFGGFVIHSAA